MKIPVPIIQSIAFLAIFYGFFQILYINKELTELQKKRRQITGIVFISTGCFAIFVIWFLYFLFYKPDS